MEVIFNNLEELRKRITPAINTKLKELKNNNYYITTEEDIWEYLKIKWRESINLTLYDIINDIINLNNNSIEEYAIKRRNEK